MREAELGRLKHPPLRGFVRSRDGLETRPRWMPVIGTASLPRDRIRRLMVLRFIAAGGQAAAIATAAIVGVSLPVLPMLSIVAALLAFNALTYTRLRGRHEFAETEVVAHLGFDLAAFTVLVALSGGATNPFVLLFVVHLVLIALLLPFAAAVTGAAVAVACYLLVLFVHRPLEMSDGSAMSAGLLAFGNALSFALTGGLTAWFVAQIVANFRERDRRASEAAQRALRDEAVLRVGALAAGAAHELATPLTTMAVLASDIATCAEAPSIQRDANALREQIKRCRDLIADLLAGGTHACATGGGRERLDRFLESIAAAARAVHPGATIRTDWTRIAPGQEIFGEQALKQALLALLDNAVDASPADVTFTGHIDGPTLCLSVADRGSGLAASDLQRLGRAFFSTKPKGKGTGLGLVIATRAIERLGGTLTWQSSAATGTRANVALPLKVLSLGSETP